MMYEELIKYVQDELRSVKNQKHLVNIPDTKIVKDSSVRVGDVNYLCTVFNVNVQSPDDAPGIQNIEQEKRMLCTSNAEAYNWYFWSREPIEDSQEYLIESGKSDVYAWEEISTHQSDIYGLDELVSQFGYLKNRQKMMDAITKNKISPTLDPSLL